MVSQSLDLPSEIKRSSSIWQLYKWLAALRRRRREERGPTKKLLESFALHEFSSFPKASVDLQVKPGKRGTELSRGKSPLCPRKELAYRNVAALKGRRLWV